jgi:dTDP-4-dehydrorhamnose 3,5-epimerase-like enzyme
MSTPDIKLLALSNVFCRAMNFKNKGDIEKGHKHLYDHATLVGSGSVRVNVYDDSSNVIASSVFKAPNMVFIRKESVHEITALEDNTVCYCIHAIRTVDQEIVDPDCIPLLLKDQSDTKLLQVLPGIINKKTNKKLENFTKVE